MIRKEFIRGAIRFFRKFVEQQKGMYSGGRVKSQYTFYNNPQLIRGGKDYFSKVKELIASATTSIQLQVYIFEEDQTGGLVASALIEAARRGLQVQVLLDGYASRKLTPAFRNRMRDAGIKLRFFEPIFKGSNFYFGRRLHHKILVADGTRALVGGINISDRYNDLPGEPAWLDWAILVEGDAAFELFKLCNIFYAKKPEDLVTLENNALLHQMDNNLHCPIRIRRNDWVMNLNQISASYMEMFKHAQQEIIIMSSYFIPSNFFRTNIIKCLKRGVRIRLILAGISDVGISKYAERYLYRWAIRHGIEIHEYKNNILHGKIAVCDARIVTIGSYNVNDISAMASIELNLDVEEVSFAETVYRTLNRIIDQDCEPVHPASPQNTYGPIERLMQWISYETFRFIFFLFTFYFTRNKQQRKTQPKAE